MSEKVTVAAAVKGMFSFFTMLPIKAESRHVDSMNRKFWLVPIIGLFYAILAAAVFCLAYKFVSPIVAAALTILIVGVMNRFLHFDGLIDVGDGLTVAGEREDHIRALKDTRVGAGGVITGITVALLLFAEYVSLDVVGFLFLGFAAEILSRNAQVSVAAFGVAGDGMAGDTVRYTNKVSLVKSSLLSVILIALSVFVLKFIADCFSWNVPTIYALAPVIGFAISIFWGWFMSRIAMKNFGIVNGDMLGAVNETSRVVMLFFMIALVTIYGLI